MNKSYLKFALLLTALCVVVTPAFSQYEKKEKTAKHKQTKGFCSSNNWSNGEKVSAQDLRETTMSSGDVRVDSKNGRITVIGETRGDVLVRACVRSWAKTEAEAKAIVESIRVETSSIIKADIPERSNTSVSYEIRVPNATNLDLSSGNGRIGISDVSGQIRFKTNNGRVTLSRLAGDVEGETTNGRITVKLDGGYWQGNGLNVSTNNGRISLYLPSSYAANVEVGTNNGRFRSSFDALQAPLDENGKRKRSGPNKVNASLNGGGAPIKLVTGNGRVSISSLKQKEKAQ